VLIGVIGGLILSAATTYFSFFPADPPVSFDLAQRAFDPGNIFGVRFNEATRQCAPPIKNLAKRQQFI
jgi:hypothetical protein